ncbi:MAG: glycerophosphodiester phosphodiesterase [Promethearchaeota archaeon]
MGYEIENTISSFERAVKIGAGIETDLYLTKDNVLVCFHDPEFQIGSNFYKISSLTVRELKEINFKDGRTIPTLQEVFQYFKNNSNALRYSCDIGNEKIGFELIKLVKKFSLFDRLEITEQNLRVIRNLRERSKTIKLVHTVPFIISKVNDKTVAFEKLMDYGVKALNVKNDRANYENLKNINDNGFECYVWGVNSKSRMKKILKMGYKDIKINAIYTNFPDILLEMLKQLSD